MVFKKSNRKTLKKRKTMKKRRPMKRRSFMNRKSKKYGGRFIGSQGEVISIMDRLKRFFAKPPANMVFEPNEVNTMNSVPYVFNGDELLKQFISARKKAENLGKSEMEQANAIHDVYKKAWEKAKSEYESKKSTQQAPPPSPAPPSPAHTMSEDTNVPNCPSLNKNPIKCDTKSDYLKQVLIFHPDKNSGCVADATEKFKQLASVCSDVLSKDKI
jgi:hypothetical protein